LNQPAGSAPSVYLSVILPVYNEAGNLKPLHEALTGALDGLNRPYEIVYCDDGSVDGSANVLRELAAGNLQTKVIVLRRNFGQTAAIAAGIDASQGEILILMDADFQNDPQDIPKLLACLEEGYDIVSGWRRRRRDPFWTKVLPSRAANWIISLLTGVKLHDHGCTLKAYRREALSPVSLYGEMHRFISLYGYWMGARVGEVEVEHHRRTRGKSKYSIVKTFKVMLDLPLLVLLGSYITRPMHFFGAIGLFFQTAAGVCALDVLYEKVVQGDKASHNPFLLLTVFFALVGVQIIMIGLLAELITRVYHESRGKKTYVIRETINLSFSDEDRT